MWQTFLFFIAAYFLQMLSTYMKSTPNRVQNKNIFSGKVDKFEVRIIQTIKRIEQHYEKIDAKTIFQVVTVCNFQSMKTPVKLNRLL